MSMIQWMVWTTPVAIFFCSIASILVVMTIWEIRSPCILRRGFLPMATTRGDRLFIGLLGSAFINLAWLGFTDMVQWIALGISLVYMLIIGRWG